MLVPTLQVGVIAQSIYIILEISLVALEFSIAVEFFVCKTFIDTLWYNCLTISVDIQILYGCSLQFPSGVPGLDKMFIEFKDWKRTA